MPNRQEHLDIGLAVAIAVGVILLSDDTRIPPIAELIGTGVGVLGGAVLPDILEPADSPNHRKSGHSTAALAGSMKLGVDPPDSVTEWRRSVRETAAAMREERESLPIDHPDRPDLWMGEQVRYLAVGATIGLPFGYASHLVADSQTPGKLPPI